jgi:hypothetical protein
MESGEFFIANILKFIANLCFHQDINSQIYITSLLLKIILLLLICNELPNGKLY